MPSRTHLAKVARDLRFRLNGHAFDTIERSEITRMLREASGEETTRLKSILAADLERLLLEQGVRCFPSLVETTTGDTVRLYHAGTLLGSLVDLLVHPSRDTDRELGSMLKKIKGQWQWSTVPLVPGTADEEHTSEEARR